MTDENSASWCTRSVIVHRAIGGTPRSTPLPQVSLWERFLFGRFEVLGKQAGKRIRAEDSGRARAVRPAARNLIGAALAHAKCPRTPGRAYLGGYDGNIEKVPLALAMDGAPPPAPQVIAHDQPSPSSFAFATSEGRLYWTTSRCDINYLQVRWRPRHSCSTGGPIGCPLPIP